jgi:hypothetical protein
MNGKVVRVVMAGALWIVGTAALAQSADGSRSAADQGSMQVGAQLSTLGLGMVAAIDVHESFTVRVLYNWFDYDYDETSSGNRFKGDLKLNSYGAMVDWHPFDNGFRVSGGALVNNNELDVRVEGDVDIGDNEYAGYMNATLDFATLAPYIGLGWSGGRSRTGLGFFADAGVLLQGSPKLAASGRAAGCNFTLSESGRATVTGCEDDDLAGDLESEHRELNEDLQNFELYPVLSLGAVYRF